MHAELASKIEKRADRCASALLACAAAFAFHASFGTQIAQPLLWAATGAAAAFAYLAGIRLLGAVEPRARSLPVAVFDVRDIGEPGMAELLLTERLEPDAPDDDELVLDDILAALGPQSRVVRLFDPAAMPTPGQLNQRIERHLVKDDTAAPADASHALHEALAELRRSLR